jgi:hypothetical protein
MRRNVACSAATLECLSRLGVCDCGRDELGELAETDADRSGNGLRIRRVATIAPQSRPSTVNGAPIAD